MKTKPFEHQAKELAEHGMDKVRAIHWEQGCFDRDTEYLTPAGWHPFSEYSGGMVAQWDQETGVAEFVQPLEYVVKPCDTMLRLKTKYGVDQMISLNHRVPYLTKHGKNPRVCFAEKLWTELTDSPSAFRHLPSTFTLDMAGSGVALTDNELRLQLAVMADGHFPEDSLGTTRTIVRVKKQQKIERLILLLDAAGLDYTRKPQSDGFHVFTFYAPTRDKHFPSDWLSKLTNQQRDIICEEVLHWDGTTKQCNAFFTTDSGDADFIQTLWASQGQIARKSWGNECWEVHLRKDVTPFTVRGANCSLEAPEDRKMYCFRVPSTFLVVRRNGCIFPSGNTGKTWLGLATMEKLHAAGEIDAAFILAPPGLHTNWVNYEIPDHLSLPHVSIAFQSKRAKTKKHQRECNAIFEDGRLPILAMSYPGIKTEAGKKLAKRFLTNRKCLYIADESNRIKTPSAKITRTVLASSDYAEYKRTLCGTPITNTPFDVYTQFRFLNKDFWSNTPYGLGSFQCFKTFFGIWEKGYNGAQDREYDVLAGYKNLEILTELVKLMSSRVLKEDVLDLPPKLYSYAGFEMTPKQWRLYKEIEDEFMTEIEGEMIFTPLAITRLLRLQQVACGYLPSGDEDECVMIEKDNPRLKALNEITQDLPHQAIIWARFLKDIDLICEMLGDKATRWDGSIGEDQREDNKRAFKDGKVQFMVATPDSMGEGHTLNEAKTTIYYSNSFKMKERHQSEDRNHRAGQNDRVRYIDIVADNTKDIDIINALREKFDNASKVVDGRIRRWLEQYDAADLGSIYE